jgi:methylated-DNA-protein-cysteine methyltransferase related protein
MDVSLPVVTPFARAVLDAVDRIPAGRVMSYGDVAEMVGAGSGRAVGTVMSRHGAEVPWHRVLRSDGSCATHKADDQLAMLRAEDVPVLRGRVDMSRARWDGHESPQRSSRTSPQLSRRTNA